MDKIKFSLVMANYNNSKYIDVAINSVLKQDYENWELVIVDDRSTDHSIEVINEFLYDERIKLMESDRNGGYGYASKICVENSTGNVIGIVDADDKLAPNALSTIQEIYRKKGDEYGFVFSSHYFCDKELGPIRVISSQLKENYLKADETLAFRTFRRDCYNRTEGFNSEQKRAVDKDIIYKLEEVTKFYYVDKPLYYYRRHGSGISQEGNQSAARIWETRAKYNAFNRRLKCDNPKNYSTKEMSQELLLTIIPCIKSKKYELIKYFLKESNRIKKFNLSAYFVLLYRLFKFVPYRLWCLLRTGSYRVRV